MAETVNKTAKVRASADESVATEVPVTLNFDNVTRGELMELAARDLIITLQARWRRNGIPTEPQTVSVRDVIDGVHRTKADPATVVRRNIDKLTDEQKAALIAQLSGDESGDES